MSATQLAALPSAEEEVALRKDLWDRVRQGYAMPLIDSDLVRKWEQYYGGQPDYMRRMTERGGRYLYHIIEEVEKRGMPTELALLPFVESAFNPQAMSSARASGMWQFMPATGRQFQLKQNLFRDDRRSVLASTRAALDYLQALHRRFGEWQLALAAYNWGEGNVQRAISRNKAAGQSIEYVALSMPNETRNYVPKLLAIRNIVLKPESFNLTLPPLQNHPYFLTVAIERDIDVALAARLADLSLDEFQQLNPQMNKPVILAAATTHLVLPFDNAKSFAQQLARHRGPTATWTVWVAPKTLKPSAAASMVGMSEAQLREVNRIPPRMLVKAGSTLLVPRAAQSTRDVSVQVADTAMISLAPESVPGRKQVVRVGARGETVASLARRYKVNVNSLAQWNGVSPKASFKPRQNVVLMLPPARARASAKGKTVAGKRAVAGKRTVRKQAKRHAAPGNDRVAKR
jgi:membrane-bound lytic murein transglycosylase D